MTHTLPAALVAALACRAVLAAQTAADFSGTWSMDASRSQSAVQNEPVKAMTLVIKQAPNELTIETRRDDRTQTVTYKPGSPGAMNATAGRGGLLASIYYWDGPKLVTEALSDVNGTTVRHKATYALDAVGAELTIESLVVVEHGYTLSGAKNYGAGKDVFKKVGP